MKRVLVTGAAGFIGRHTVDMLQTAGYEVHAVSRSERVSNRPVCWHSADLLDVRSVAELMNEVRPSHLLHLAWVTAHGDYWNSSENVRWVQTTLELLRLFPAYGGRRFVFAGTCAEYDCTQGYLTEGLTPTIPTTLYGKSKLAVESLTESFAAEQNLTFACGRIFHLFGPFEDRRRFVSSIIVPLLAGERAICRNGEQVRDFLYVTDVASAFVTLLESDKTGPVNIGSGRPVRLAELAAKIASLLGVSQLLDIRTDENKKDDLLVPNVKRLHEEIQWRPAVTLEKGLEETVEWWKDRAVAKQS